MSETKPGKVWDKSSKWPDEIALLKTIIAKAPLEETVKWGGATFVYQGKNVVGIAGFKNYVTLWFYNGVFLKDPKKLLVSAQEQTRSLRQLRFENKNEIAKNKNTILAYILEAIEIEKAGLSVKPQKKKLVIPEIFQNRLESDIEFSSSFHKLTPGKQREYAGYIAEAKQEKTKLTRLEKIVPLVKSGIGINDKYK